MIKTIFRAMYSAFISIVLISIILAGWTSFVFISQPTKSGEIINVIQDIYESQKSVIVGVINLSNLLIKEKSAQLASDDSNIFTESELLADQEKKSLLIEQLILEDNEDNPLGIVTEQSVPKVSEENLSESSLGQLDNDQSEVSMNKMEIEVERN